LDRAFAECPEHDLREAAKLARASAECTREALYHQLLEHFDEHGVVPEFTLQKKAGPPHSLGVER
jgi:hypothetical protein